MKKIGIAGSGLMGISMAQCFAKHGYEVYIYDISAHSLKQGENLIKANQKAEVSQNKITEEQSQAIISRISFNTDLESSFSEVNYLIEAIKEELATKQDFWKKVETIAPKDCIFATNTSSLSITQIALKMQNKQRFGGMHWFNPPHLIPLVEVIKGQGTAEETSQKIYKLALSIEKIPIVVEKDVPGFVGNRLQHALFREAVALANDSVASIYDIDKAVKYGIGFRWACMGPFEIADQGGVDLWYRVNENLFKELDVSQKPTGIIKNLYEQGDFGITTGKGFYEYDLDSEVDIKKRGEFYNRLAAMTELNNY